jgi:hypothetical protein
MEVGDSVSETLVWLKGCVMGVYAGSLMGAYFITGQTPYEGPGVSEKLLDKL